MVQEIKQLYTTAIPMIITGLLIYGKSMISMLFMGRLGKEALAGGSLSVGIANITGYSIISGLAHGNGSHLFSSFWGQAMGHHGPNPPPNNCDPPPRFHTNISPLAKHQPNPPPLWPRPNHFLHCFHLPRFLCPRPFIPILHQPSENLLTHPKHNSSINAQCSFFACYSRPHQLLSSALSPLWD